MLIRALYESAFVRFAVVGGIATGVNYATYVVLVRHFDDLRPAFAYVCASASCVISSCRVISLSACSLR